MTMTVKDIKEEARHKLALNMHQAIVVYTVEFAIFITLIALVVMSCVSFGINSIASIVMTCYGVLLGLIAVVGIGMVNFAMTDFYLVTYRCKPYNIRRLGETLARSNITKILLLSLKRTVIGILLTLCLIVPGVIYFMRTSMANFLLIANPKMRASTALTASNKVMSGKTGTYFSLCMSLIGWYLLGVLTLGLGFIFISPYTHLVKAVYYKRNLQGDKAAYYVQPQPVSPQPQQPMQQAATMQPQNNSGNPPLQPQGPAPIDALADDDFNDMNAAIRDFGTEPEANEQTSDVPEVVIAPVTENKKSRKEKKTKEQTVRAKTQDGGAPIEHKIDGTGLVETERILSTQEISDTAERKKQILENMYSNSKPDAPKVNYFDMSRRQTSDDFVDDFGVEPSVQTSPEPAAEATVVEAQPVVVEAVAEPVAEAQPTAEPIVETVAQPVQQPALQAQPAVEPVQPIPQQQAAAEPVISDSEFDEFLKNFDSALDEPTPAPATEPQPPPTAQQSVPPQTDRRAEFAMRAAEKRRETEERIARDRAANAGRTPIHDRPERQTVNDRAERIRREREQRLNQNNNGGR